MSAKAAQREFQILGVRARELHGLPSDRVSEGQLGGMKPLTIEPQFLGKLGVCAVEWVARQRAAEVGKVDPDLMSATSLKTNLNQTCSREDLESFVVSNGPLTIVGNCEFVIMLGGSSYWSVYCS